METGQGAETVGGIEEIEAGNSCALCTL